MPGAAQTAHELVGAVVHLLEALQAVRRRVQHLLHHGLGHDRVGHDRVALALQEVDGGHPLAGVEAALDVAVVDGLAVQLLHELHSQSSSVCDDVLSRGVVGVHGDLQVDLAVSLVRFESYDGAVGQVALDAGAELALRLLRRQEAQEVGRVRDAREAEDRGAEHPAPLDARSHAAALVQHLRPAGVGRQQGPLVAGHRDHVLLARRVLAVHPHRPDQAHRVLHGADVVLDVVLVHVGVVDRLLIRDILPEVLVLDVDRVAVAEGQLSGLPVRQARSARGEGSAALRAAGRHEPGGARGEAAQHRRPGTRGRRRGRGGQHAQGPSPPAQPCRSPAPSRTGSMTRASASSAPPRAAMTSSCTASRS
mmetsp:Transcript_9743/g.21424  ORF Transcript_9743/g.21424 Transcript_9743/m.21424 type:complete len:365 (-) Transcript_9743:138-1232(-)